MVTALPRNDELRMQSPPAAKIHDRYDTIWNRLGAFAIDSVLLSPVWLFAPLWYRKVVGEPLGPAWSLLLLLVCTAYYVYFHGRTGQTPGKRLLRVRVVAAADEQPISYFTAGERELPWILSAVLGALLADFFSAASLVKLVSNLQVVFDAGNVLLIFLTAKHRGLEDFIAGTVVVRTSAAPDIPARAPTSSEPDAFVPSLYCRVSRGRRVGAAVLNLFLFAGLPYAAEIIAGLVFGTATTKAKVLITAGLLILIWGFTLIVRSSPGGLFCKLVVRHWDNRPLRWHTHVLRTLPHFLLGLSVTPNDLIPPQAQIAHAAIFWVIALPMLLNAVAFATSGVSLIDRWLQLSWFRLNLPPDLSRRY